MYVCSLADKASRWFKLDHICKLQSLYTYILDKYISLPNFFPSLIIHACFIVVYYETGITALILLSVNRLSDSISDN